MDFNHFLHERRPRWQRFAALLDRVDAGGPAALNPVEADEFFSLYRMTSSDLNLVQTRTANASLIDYLEGLVARGYAQLAVPRRPKFFRAWWQILRHDFPAAIRAEWRVTLASALALVLGTLVGFAATLVRPSTGHVFLPAEHLQESPSERVATLEEEERTGHRRISAADDHALFTVFLFNNNIRVSVLAFALGVTFGVGTIVVLFFNGAMLGSLAALYLRDGVGVFFVAWVGPHGSIELPCVIFAGAAGLMLSMRQLRRGEGTFASQVRRVRPRLVNLLVGTATLLVIAGTVEGGFSQINEPTIPYWLKIAVAVALFGMLVGYLFFLPVKPTPAGDRSEG